MITLKEAMKLTNVSNDECCWLRRKDASWHDRRVYTGIEIKNRFDMIATKVISIRPVFLSGDYEGFEFEITE